MRATPRRDTPPELALRRALRSRGLHYRVDYPVLPRRRADVVFVAARIAVFVDGCFWHCCPVHGTAPKANAGWWRDKLASNRARDLDTTKRLEEEGWAVVRIWEHDDPEQAADQIADLASRRRKRT